MEQLGLRAGQVISDDGDSFVTVACRDETGQRVVLKYVRSGRADAYRRLTNETLLIRHLRVRPPLRLLRPRAAGHGYLVTEFADGVLLRPDRFDERTAAAIADALVVFQALRLSLRGVGVVDREPVARYYVKVLLKHLLHLWPAVVSTREAARSVSILTRALPAIQRLGVMCHGDFLPTNLLYHAEDTSVTFTDLEGVMSRNHPLFDVLALVTASGLDLRAWRWQERFLSRYLEAGAAAHLGLDPASREYREAYRGLLIFFLVYRLNEHRVDQGGRGYFDGLPKHRFLARRFGQLATGRRQAWRDEGDSVMDVRKRNLRLALSTAGFREHFDAIHASAMTQHVCRP